MYFITVFQILKPTIDLSASVSPDLIQGVPSHLDGWEHEFTIPKQYSGTVMAALTTKKISSNVRAQISQDVATKMLSYCKYPTADQYEVIAQKIVSAFPVLKDSMGVGYVSIAECTIYLDHSLFIFLCANQLCFHLLFNSTVSSMPVSRKYLLPFFSPSPPPPSVLSPLF